MQYVNQDLNRLRRPSVLPFSPSGRWYPGNPGSDPAPEEALLAARYVHEGGMAFQVLDGLLLGGNMAQTGRDRRLEATLLAGPAKDLVGGGLIAFREGFPLMGEQDLAGGDQLAGLPGRGAAGRNHEAGHENAGPGGCRH